MSELTVAEEVILIALDNDSGAGKLRLGLDWAVAGAVVVDLVLSRRITVDDDDRVTVLDASPTGVAHLDSALGKLSTAERFKVSRVLRRTHHSAPGTTVSSLVDRGVLRKKRVPLLPMHRYPAQETTTEAEVRRRLSAAVLERGTPDERTAALVGVLHAAKLWRKAFPAGDRKYVKGRMADIAAGQAISPAVRKAITRTQAAIIAATATAANAG
ncbi:Golgi phosphoprotein 3 GPP34 [Kribbella amoyensis]|uniref:Golgi phosphoprotein 3 GPP34 n=1 Tax=Kribbella amoyensis TaxID=996641 RepID=A0A561BQU8_9ACTN|nr:GPP34 family phosphoprotein [Kribbella amoyensis]TWD81234.1 Golgi phosphoprotein 3 GPP34 [Kribbella amoyensis]